MSEHLNNEENVHTIYEGYQRQHNRPPRSTELMKYIKCTESEAKEWHKKLVADGHVKKNKNKTEYYKRNLLKVPEKKKVVPSTGDGLDNRAFVFMRFVMLAAGLGSVVMSIYYSQAYLVSFAPRPLAIFAGFIFVSFEVLGFDFAAVMISQKRYLLGIGLIFAAVVVMAFSINSTVGCMYANSSDKLNKGLTASQSYEKAEEKDNREWDALQEQKVTVTEALTDIREVIKNYTEELKSLPVGSDLHSVTAWRLSQAEAKRDKYSSDLKEIQIRETDFLDRQTEESDEVVIYKKSYSEWIGGAVFKKVRPELFEFIMAIVPAVLYDILAPLTIGVFLFTGNGARRKED